MGQSNNYAFRIGVEGRAQVLAEFGAMQAGGTATFEEIGRAAVAESQRATEAVSTAAARQLEVYRAMGRAHAAEVERQSQQNAVNQVLASQGVAQSGAGVPQWSRQLRAEMEEAAAEAQRFETRVIALRAAIDPVGAAQAHMNRELAEYQQMAARGIITTNELALAEANLRKRVDEVTASYQREQRTGLSRAQQAGRLNLGRQAADVFTTGAMGMSPAMIAIQQGPQILDAMREAGVRLTPALLGVGAAVGTVVGTFVTLGVAYLRAAGEQRAFEESIQGTGRAAGLSVSQLQGLADHAAEVAHITTSAAAEQAVAYANTGRVGGEVMSLLIERGRQYQQVIGGDSQAATQALAQAMADPARAADDWAARLGLLDSKQVENIHTLVEQNRYTEAQLMLLQAMPAQLDQAADHVNALSAAWQNVSRMAINAFTEMGRAVNLALGGGTHQERIQSIMERLQGVAPGPAGDAIRNQARAELHQEWQAWQDEQTSAATRAAEVARNRADSAFQTAFDRARPTDARRRQFDSQRGYFENLLQHPDQIPQGRSVADVRSAIAGIDQQEAQLDRHRRTRHDGHAQALAREGASLEANARGALAVAAAYLEGDQAAMQAAAARTAETRAARNGADAELRTRQQLNLAIAEAAANGARGVNDNRAQADAQAVANDAVSSGILSHAEAQRQMQVELQLRPPLAAQALAHGDALTRLTDIIQRYRNESKRANDEQARSAVLASTEGFVDQADRAHMERRLAAASDMERAVAMARFDAAAQIRKAGLNNASPEAMNLETTAVAAAMQQVLTARAQFIEERRRSAAEALQTAQLELSLVGRSAAVHDVLLARLRAEQELRARGVDLASAEARADVDRAEALARIGLEIQRQQATWQELQQTGSGVLDSFDQQLFNSDQSWNAWRDFGLNALRDIEHEFFRLAALNPLKNALFGQSNPTLGDAGGIFGFLRGLIGGGGGGGASGVDLSGLLHLAGHAAGTGYSPGGLHWVGEFGPELVRMPRGAAVTPAGPSRELMRAANSNAPHVSVTYAPVQTFTGTGDEVAQFRAETERDRRDFTANVVTTVNQAAMNGHLVYGRPQSA